MSKPNVVISTRLREIADRVTAPMNEKDGCELARELEGLADILDARVAAKNAERAAAAALTDAAQARIAEIKK